MQRPSPCRSSEPSRILPKAMLRMLMPIAAVALACTAAPLRAQERAAIKKVSPTYPAIARQMGITGTVIVAATVDPSGKVIKAESSSGNKLLANSAIDAVKQWKFTPAETTDTIPVSVNFEKN